MKRRLPSLNALKAFEASARHESFTQAARELCVTQGAVSQQVRALEADLDRKSTRLNSSHVSESRMPSSA